MAPDRPTYTVEWRRESEPDEKLKCTGLSKSKMLNRLRGAIRNSGPIIVDAIERD